MKIAKHTTIVFVTIMLLFSCTKDDITINDVIKSIEIDKLELVADNSDLANVLVTFEKNINPSLIKLKVKLNNGVIVDASTPNKAEFVPETKMDNTIVTEFQIKSTTVNSNHEILFEIDDYERTEEVLSVKSTPSSLSISSDSFSVDNDLASEITITGLILNEAGKFVSNNTKVIFEDTFDNGTSVNGHYREKRNNSNSESKISTIYSPGFIDGNQYINLKVTVLNEDGSLSDIEDSIRIFVNKTD